LESEFVNKRYEAVLRTVVCQTSSNVHAFGL
jgi:hypothetical protein